ncbi:MAG: hypothetical protein AAGE76_07570 [Pseudomonadota bacterium]
MAASAQAFDDPSSQGAGITDPGEVLALPAALTPAAATEALAALRARRSAPVRLAAGAVETVSAPFVLTLVAAIRDRAPEAPKIALAEAPQTLIDAFGDLGFFEDLMQLEFPT